MIRYGLAGFMSSPCAAEARVPGRILWSGSMTRERWFALPGFALHVDRAAVRTRRSRPTKLSPSPCPFSGDDDSPGPAHAIEAVEDVRQMFGRNALVRYLRPRISALDLRAGPG